MGGVVVLDLETDAIKYTACWNVCVHNLNTNEKETFLRPDIDLNVRARLKESSEGADMYVMHNGAGFDMWVLSELCGIELDLSKLFDTLVVGLLVCPRLLKDNKLATIGEFFKYPKPEIEDFSVGNTPEMLERVSEDVEITRRWYLYLVNLINKKGGISTWREPIRLETEIAHQLIQFKKDGYWFNKGKAIKVHKDISDWCNKLEAEFQEQWPPTLEVDRTLKYRTTKSGTLFASVISAQEKFPKTEVVGDQLICYDWVPFNPNNSKHRVSKLNEAGWSPVIKTDGHYKFEREINPRRLSETDRARQANFLKFGWKICDENLETLPKDAPQVAHNLAAYLTLKGRLSDLEEWLECVEDDNRVHGTFFGIGSWTQRLSHSKPNLANIFAPFHGEANTLVKQIKEEYDYILRSLWGVPKGKYQLGCDAEGIQLRLLAHFMQSEMYRDAILSGNKEDGTDIHNLNRRALGLPWVTRDMAKTFIYAFLLGAGIGRTQRTLECTYGEAKQAIDSFYESIDGLHELKNVTIPKLYQQGGFVGIDGRIVKPPSEYHMLAGMLQNGEVVLMKKALTIWRRKAISIPHKLLAWPHDEWQTELNTLEDAHTLGKIQASSIVEAGEYFNLFCPMGGEYKVGTNWAETH
jgi:DNA polymerase-1